MASNFATAMKALTVEFEKTTAHHVVLSFGSTGKHYAQIKNGAPFDVFLAADAAATRAFRRVKVSLCPGSRRLTYARGKLTGPVDFESLDVDDH